VVTPSAALLCLAGSATGLQRTLDFAVSRGFIAGVPKDGGDHHCTCQSEDKREGYENSFHWQT
jgi:hypothetical protein